MPTNLDRLRQDAAALEAAAGRLAAELADVEDEDLRAALVRFHQHKAATLEAVADVEARLQTLGGAAGAGERPADDQEAAARGAEPAEPDDPG